MDSVPYWWCPLSFVLGIGFGGLIGYLRGHEEGTVSGWSAALTQFEHWRQGTSK